MNNKKITNFYHEAIDLIAQGGSLQDLASLTHHIFHLPIIIVDIGYQVLASTDSEEFADPNWKSLTEKGGASDQTVVNFYLKDGLLDAISKSDGSIYVDWGICTSYPQTSGPIYVNQKLEGFVSILFLDSELLDFSLSLNSTLCKLCSIIMSSGHYHLKQTLNPVKEIFAQKLFNTDDFPKAPDLSGYEPFIAVKPSYRFIILSSTKGSGILEHIRSKIINLYPDTIYMLKDEALYLFFHHHHQVIEDDFLSYLMCMLTDYDLFCGVSKCFTNLNNRFVYIEQAKQSLQIGKQLAPSKRLYLFDAYYTDIILSQAASSLCYENYIPEELRRLALYDLENKTDYIHTLYTYLYLRNDINQTAKELHLHRNSLTYRLSKISDFLGIDINEPYQAQRLHIGLLLQSKFSSNHLFD